jgi:serine/threonine protein kinase
MATDHDLFRDLTLLEQRQVNTICDEFEAALKQGHEPRLEDFLTEATGVVWDVLLRELLVLECEYGLRQHTAADRSRLAARFPGNQALIDQILEVAQCNLAIRPTREEKTEAQSSETEKATDFAETIGRFRLLSVLGHGAFGSVFRAIDTANGREVALKVPHIITLVTPELRDRFLSEARAAGALDHPRIVKPREVGEAGRVCYIVSDYVPGITLANWLRERYERQEAAEFNLAAKWTGLLAEAIHHAHGRDVLHCDLKPANILLREGPELDPVVTDFGLARLVGQPSELTGTGQFLGTPAYMAPEQVTGQRCDLLPTVDVYGLGAILYEMVTGRAPFQGKTLLEILDQKCNSEPVSPRVLVPKLPRDLETICLKCLQKEPRCRYQSAAGLADDIRCFLARKPIKARPVSPPERLWRWCHRRPAIAALSAALAGVVIASFCALWMSESRAREGERLALERQHQAEAAQHDAENSRTETLRLLSKVANLAATASHKHPDQGLPIGILEQAEAHLQDQLHKRPENLELTFLLARICAQQATRHEAMKQPEMAVAAHRRAARVLQEVVNLLRPDQPNDFLKSELMLPTATANGSALESLASQHQYLMAELLNRLAYEHSNAGDKVAAKETYERVALICIQLAKEPPSNTSLRTELAKLCWNIGHILRTHDSAAASLKTLECARPLYEGLARDFPAELSYAAALSDVWYQLAQTRRELGQHEEAFATYREAVKKLRLVFDKAPEVVEYRQKLSLFYSKVAYWLRKRGYFAEAADNLLEQKKLWPGNAEKLHEIANDFGGLAAAVGAGRQPLTAAEQAERQRFLDSREEIAREAAAARAKLGQ